MFVNKRRIIQSCTNWTARGLRDVSLSSRTPVSLWCNCCRRFSDRTNVNRPTTVNRSAIIRIIIDQRLIHWSTSIMVEMAGAMQCRINSSGVKYLDTVDLGILKLLLCWSTMSCTFVICTNTCYTLRTKCNRKNYGRKFKKVHFNSKKVALQRNSPITPYTRKKIKSIPTRNFGHCCKEATELPYYISIATNKVYFLLKKSLI